MLHAKEIKFWQGMVEVACTEDEREIARERISYYMQKRFIDDLRNSYGTEF